MAKKRKKGEGTVRHRKDGRWEGRMVIGYDRDGNPKTKSVLAKTKAECVEKLEKLKAADETKRPVKVKADMAFGDWLDFWYQSHMESKGTGLSDRSVRSCYAVCRMALEHQPKPTGLMVSEENRST